MATLTVFTPTYNRAYILKQCYDSLCRQTCKDFVWLIVDDGSSDNTKELVDSWLKKDNGFKIRYTYKENGGMHTAHNKAYELIDTELNVCIDSDDYMTDNAVEIIINEWKKNKSEDLAGLIGLDAFENGQIIGDEFPDDLYFTTLYNFYYKLKKKGDKKIVYRSELSKLYPYPVFEGEKYVGLAYKYYKLDQKYKLKTLNKVLCIVEYMEDGSSKNMMTQYRKNPKGFAFFRKENMKNPNASFIYKLKENIHYVSSSFILKNKRFIEESPLKVMTILAIPFGFLLYIWIKHNNKKGV